MEGVLSHEQGSERSDIRIRLPRGQLRDDEHTEWSPRCRKRGGGSRREAEIESGGDIGGFRRNSMPILPPRQPDWSTASIVTTRSTPVPVSCPFAATRCELS